MTIRKINQWTDRDPIEEEIRGTELKLKWLKTLQRYRRALDEISDIVKLDSLWDWVGDCRYSALELAYAGKANNHKEAALDLSRIMEALHCTDLKLRVVGGGNNRPYGKYQGSGRLGNKKVEISLSVKWLPEGCKITMGEPRRSWSTSRQYHTYCQR